MKKGQLSRFLFIGILMLVAVGLVAYTHQPADNGIVNDAALQGSLTSLRSYATMCLQQGLVRGVDILGPSADAKFYEAFVSSHFRNCIADESLSNQGININELEGELGISVSDRQINASVNFPIEVSQAGRTALLEGLSASLPLKAQESLPIVDGATAAPFSIKATNSKAEVLIPEGTKVTDYDGNPLASMDISVIDKHFNGFSNDLVVGNSIYDFTPARFSQPVTVTFHYNDEDIPQGFSARDLSVIWYDPEARIWKGVPSTVDTMARTVSGQLSHFTLVADGVGCLAARPQVLLAEDMLIYLQSCGDENTCKQAKWQSDNGLREKETDDSGKPVEVGSLVSSLVITPNDFIPYGKVTKAVCTIKDWNSDDTLSNAENCDCQGSDDSICITKCQTTCKRLAASYLSIGTEGDGIDDNKPCECDDPFGESCKFTAATPQTYGYQNKDGSTSDYTSLGGFGKVEFDLEPDGCYATANGQAVVEIEADCDGDQCTLPNGKLAEGVNYFFNPVIDATGKLTDKGGTVIRGRNTLYINVENRNSDGCAYIRLKKLTISGTGLSLVSRTGTADDCTIQDRIDFLCRFGPSGDPGFNERGDNGYPNNCEQLFSQESTPGKQEWDYLISQGLNSGGRAILLNRLKDYSPSGIVSCWRDNADILSTNPEGLKYMNTCTASDDLLNPPNAARPECICGNKLFSPKSTPTYHFCCRINPTAPELALFDKACGTDNVAATDAKKIPPEGDPSFGLTGLQGVPPLKCCCKEIDPNNEYMGDKSVPLYKTCDEIAATDCKKTDYPFEYKQGASDNVCEGTEQPLKPETPEARCCCKAEEKDQHYTLACQPEVTTPSEACQGEYNIAAAHLDVATECKSEKGVPALPPGRNMPSGMSWMTFNCKDNNNKYIADSACLIPPDGQCGSNSCFCLPDKCDGANVMEAVCENNGNNKGLTYTTLECDQGTVCQDGACPAPAGTKTCTKVGKTLELRDTSSNEVLETETDGCLDGKTMRTWTCTQDGPKSQDETCAACLNDVCLKEIGCRKAGGLNLHQKDTMQVVLKNGQFKEFTDYCAANGFQVNEYVCVIGLTYDKFPEPSVYPCPDFEICADGACVPKAGTCTDSDENELDQNTVQGTTIDSDTPEKTETDSCNGDTLTEWRCTGEEGSRHKIRTTKNCKDYGPSYVCDNGACKPESCSRNGECRAHNNAFCDLCVQEGTGLRWFQAVDCIKVDFASTTDKCECKDDKPYCPNAGSYYDVCQGKTGRFCLSLPWSVNKLSVDCTGSIPVFESCTTGCLNGQCT